MKFLCSQRNISGLISELRRYSKRNYNFLHSARVPHNPRNERSFITRGKKNADNIIKKGHPFPL